MTIFNSKLLVYQRVTRLGMVYEKKHWKDDQVRACCSMLQHATARQWRGSSLALSPTWTTLLTCRRQEGVYPLVI